MLRWRTGWSGWPTVAKSVPWVTLTHAFSWDICLFRSAQVPHGGVSIHKIVEKNGSEVFSRAFMQWSLRSKAVREQSEVLTFGLKQSWSTLTARFVAWPSHQSGRFASSVGSPSIRSRFLSLTSWKISILITLEGWSLIPSQDKNSPNYRNNWHHNFLIHNYFVV